VDDVLQPHGHAVERAPEPSLSRFDVQPPGGLEGAPPVDRHPGLDLLLAGVDAAEAGLYQVDGREPALADRGGGVDD
jgi:hypothetical protein